jgi:hypothetical protein
MTHEDLGGGPEPEPVGRIWLKYLLAVTLSIVALLAGTTGIGPWPESGLVSGLILLATGPLFALRLSSYPPDQPSRQGQAGLWKKLPWLTAVAGLVEIAFILATAITRQ